jgi:trk system potassium uptake protein TrkA
VHVVVVGCGRVGSELAGSLEKTGHTVAIVDKRKEAFRRLPTGFGGYRIVGFGFDRDTLQEAGIADAGALAAVTSGDNSNIMSARVARETFHVERVVARIYDPRRAAIYQRLGIPTVATVSWTTDQVLRRLVPGAHPADWTDASGRVCLLERDLPAAWAGKNLIGLDEPGAFTLAAVTRLGEARVAEPSLVGQEGDILHFIADTTALDALQHRLEAGDESSTHH